jgi:hypothetical protein
LTAASPSGASATWKRDRRFFTGMAALCALTVFLGFAPTYYLKAPFGAPPLPGLLHLHGFLFSAWILLFLAQTLLVSARRTDLHMRLGVLTAVVGALLPLAAFPVAIWSARRGFTPPGGPPPLVFLAVPMADLVVFAALLGAGLYWRRTPETHKRLMLMATISILTPAIARLPHVAAAGPAAFLGLTDLFVVACLVYDKVTRGRVHPAFWAGAIWLLVSQPARILISGTSAWLSFAGWLIR